MNAIIRVNISVESEYDAKMIAHDLGELLNTSGITNSVTLEEVEND
jgi:hypothetical protein